MGAITPARRSRTAHELAKAFDRSPRTIRRVIAEPREQYLTSAQKRREEILRLHSDGLGVRAIARTLDCSPGLVSLRLKEAREAGEIGTD